MEVDQLVPPLPERPEGGHKGTFGTVAVVAGSVGMAGAAGLCGGAVLRGGAGLCRIVCPEPIQPQVATMVPCATTLPLAAPQGWLHPGVVDAAVAAADQAGVLALGPGLGNGPDQSGFVRRLLETTRAAVVLDADGLNCLGPLGSRVLVRPAGSGPVIVTPHPGEASRLLDRPIAAIQADRRGAALDLAQLFDSVAVLKGAGTVVAQDDRVYENGTGNSGLATGGSGDVLTGLIAALLAQGMEAVAAARLGVWLHGCAGDLACERLTPWCLTGSDLLEWLPAAFAKRHEERR